MEKRIDDMHKAILGALKEKMVGALIDARVTEKMPEIAMMSENPLENIVPQQGDYIQKYTCCNAFKAFAPNQCHVCHCLEDELQTLKRCSRCRMISYCSTAHQKEDWSSHKNLCKVLSDLGGPKMFQKLKENHNPTSSMTKKVAQLKTRMAIKTLIMTKVTEKLERKLYVFESQMINHPRICFHCFDSEAELINCRNCPNAAFCKDHAGDSEHFLLCPQLMLCREIELDHLNRRDFFTQLRKSKFDFHLENTRLPKSMKEFLQTSVKVNKDRIKYLDRPELWEVYLSEAISRPLTLVHVIQKLKLPVKSRLVVHVIGADMEEVGMSIWEVVLHWLPSVTELRIAFVGPELDAKKTYTSKLCKKCCEKKKELNFETFNDQYEMYSTLSISALKPDIVIGYNMAPFAYTTWTTSIGKLVTMQSPLIITATSEIEAYRVHHWMKSCLCTAEYYSSKPNPFASLLVERAAEHERLVAKNKYTIIYKDLYNLSQKPCSGCCVTPATTNFPWVNLQDLASSLLFNNNDDTIKESDKEAGPKKKTEPMPQSERKVNKRLKEKLKRSKK
ncbi:uncharacterized protein LOC117168405 [Belonocnema kinseyi]|uniref:uncharacterized protein LOC117168405 n=1 Tax=Belonocnema kinseyi TaxID=2817044 RepID=UPI00143D0FBC|nr:uncharacterized protein LOC117168405 [Belonocnema kinseyi]